MANREKRDFKSRVAVRLQQSRLVVCCYCKHVLAAWRLHKHTLYDALQMFTVTRV